MKKIKFIKSFILPLILATSFSIIANLITSSWLSSDESAKEDTPKIENKIHELNSISTSLKKLDKFIKEQKQIIVTQQEMINSLQIQSKELEPIVNSNQATVDAIMKEAARKAEKNIWKERIIGSIFGIIGSLIAAWIWSKGKKLRIQNIV